MNRINMRGLTDRLYNRRSSQHALVASMLLWFMGGRDIAGNSPYGFLIVMAVSYSISVIAIDEVIYLFELSLEMRMRKLLDDDGLLLPRNYSSDRLAFRELGHKDFALIKELSSDKSVQLYVDDIDSNMNRNQARRWLTQHMRLERTSLRCTRVMVLKSTGQAVGAVVVINGHEIEYWIKASERMKDIAFEAVRASIDIIEQEENIVLFARCYRENTASARLLEKLGFVYSETGSDEKLQWVYEGSSRNI